MTRITSYREFFRFYLTEHARPETRALHYCGVLAAVACVGCFVVTLHRGWIVGALFAGYGPAWIGHFFIERNRPATFRYPLWSLVSDFYMTALWLGGRLDRHLREAGVVE